MPANIDWFNQSAATILARLYERFPASTLIDTEELPEPPEGAPQDDPHSATIDFLMNEGFIRGKCMSQREHSIHDVTLTAKGLAVLTAMPGSLPAKTPISK